MEHQKMKPIKYPVLFTIVACFIATMAFTAEALAQAKPVKTSVTTPIGTIEFENNYPTEESVDKLFDAMDFQRATQAYLWAVPAVSFESFRQGMKRDLGVGYNDFAIWDKYVDTKGLYYTANNTTIYSISQLDLGRDGLVVIDVPAGAVAGMLDDFWQRSASDIGLSGPDKGKGGKYLVVPPDYDGDLPESGYYVIRATMNNNNFMLRGFVENGDLAKAVSTLKKANVYPYSSRQNPRRSTFTSGSGKVVDTLIPSDMKFWERLSTFINNNQVDERDRFFMAMLKPLGIEKGKPFSPNERQARILMDGLRTGEAMARAVLNEGEKRFDAVNKWKGTNWGWALILNADQETKYYSQIDERLNWFFGATYMASAMAHKKPGPGSQYIQTFKDADDRWLDGSQTYRLRIPANPPAKQFWSLTVYDNQSRSMLQNPPNDASLSSYDKLRKNDDGSVDVYFGPKAPEGYANNWTETVPGKGFFVWFRAYTPTEAFFDNSWSLKDIEKVR
jgi:hypothetical protein